VRGLSRDLVVRACQSVHSAWIHVERFALLVYAPPAVLYTCVCCVGLETTEGLGNSPTRLRYTTLITDTLHGFSLAPWSDFGDPYPSARSHGRDGGCSPRSQVACECGLDSALVCDVARGHSVSAIRLSREP